MNFTRLEKEGVVAFTDGTRALKIAAEATCKQRLQKLLEDAQGDPNHLSVRNFWNERARDIGDSDELKAAWATEYFLRLDKLWEELVGPSDKEPDVFGDFGL